MKARIVAVLITLFGSGFCLVRAYTVEPHSAQLGGWTHGEDGYVSEILTCNFDEVVYCELFAGETLTGQNYNVDVYESPGGTNRVAYGEGAHATQPQSWVRLPLTTVSGKSFTKAKLYEFRFTRGGADSLEYYWSDGDPYKYGFLSASGSHAGQDLCAKVYGRMNKVDSLLCSVDDEGPPWNDAVLLRNRWDSLARETRVGGVRRYLWWEIVEEKPGMDTLPLWFAGLDTALWRMMKTDSIEVMLCLCGCPRWASTRIVPIAGRDSLYPNYLDTCIRCAPRNLWAPWPSSDTTDTNYWARYLYRLVRHTDSIGCTLHTFEIYNEPNDTCPDPPNPNITGWWRRPNQYYPESSFAGLWGMAALYMRMAQVAASVIRKVDSPVHLTDTILIGAVYGTVAPGGGTTVGGAKWIDMCYQVADDYHWGTFWDGVSVHAYQNDDEPSIIEGFDPVQYESDADTIRKVMRYHDHAGGELWNTEFSWDTADGSEEAEQSRACNFTEAYVSTKASEALPQGGYDRAFWWGFREGGPRLGNFPLLDSAIENPYMLYYACKQMMNRLTGQRFNGRVMTGDTLTDPLVRIYEFEDASDKRTWVCWRNGPPSGGSPESVAIQLPARTDEVDCESLAYGTGESQYTDTAATDGWYGLEIGTRPRFITEPPDQVQANLRPDLVVDSFRVTPLQPQVGKPMCLSAYVTNRGNRATPDSVWHEFLCDDVPFCSIPGASIDSGASDTLTVIGCIVPNWMRGRRLFRLQANPGQKFVEKVGLDDNDGYSRNTVVRSPDGVVDIVVPPMRKTDAGLLPMRLTSHSWESDTTGQQSADSARAIFSWYGQRDSVVHTADTTAWFPFCADTVLQFPRECGKFKVYAQFRDSGANDSPAYPDSADTVVVFDSVAALGSIVINSGARFAPSATCTLRLAACDSASGVGWMRFMNRPPVNLVRNGAFALTDGSWSFTSGGYDSSLHMASLSVSPSAESKARQFVVPVESISAHYGDSCVLEASILTHMHGGSASGDVSFWYWRTRTNLQQHDTVWLSLGSASYSGDVISLTGRYNLSARFLLAPPTSYQGWVWRGGMVQVRAQGLTSGTGHVWTDNVSLNLFQPQSCCAWWGTYDTLAVWTMGSAAGEHVIRGLYLDSAGTENAVALADTIILDPTPPVVHISLPQYGQFVSDTVEITGWGYDPIEVAGDTWFQQYVLKYRHSDSTNWLPVQPDSVSYEPAYPNWNDPLSPAVHLGYWSTDSLPDGSYYVQLTATDSAGHALSYVTWVVIDHDTSGGRFCAGPPGGGSGLGEGSIYVGSGTGCLLHLSDALDSLGALVVTDSGSAAYVTAILETRDDSLLVLDARGRRIHKLSRTGQNRRRLVSNLTLPVALAKDAHDNLWLVDKATSRIGKFRSDGTLVFTRGGQGRDSTCLNSPEAIAVKDSLVYVADSRNSRIVVWDTCGTYQGSITGDFESPTAIAVTDSGSIYVTDGADGKLKGITPRGGRFLTITEANGSELKGLVFSENKHSLFTLAPQSNVIHKFRIQSDDSMPGGVQSQGTVNLPKFLNLAQPFPNPARTRLQISYALPRQTRVSVKLYDIAGKLVKTLASADQKPGYYNLTWNREDAKGRTCACGVYFCTLAAEGQRFSRKVVLTE